MLRIPYCPDNRLTDGGDVVIISLQERISDPSLPENYET
jgi:hypothetical protein